MKKYELKHFVIVCLFFYTRIAISCWTNLDQINKDIKGSELYIISLNQYCLSKKSINPYNDNIIDHFFIPLSQLELRECFHELIALSLPICTFFPLVPYLYHINTCFFFPLVLIYLSFNLNNGLQWALQLFSLVFKPIKAIKEAMSFYLT